MKEFNRDNRIQRVGEVLYSARPELVNGNKSSRERCVQATVPVLEKLGADFFRGKSKNNMIQ